MATYKQRGASHCIIFPYKDESGKKRQQWETYTTELEASQRKVYIDILQKNKSHAEILQAARDYKEKQKISSLTEEPLSSLPSVKKDNLGKTYRELVDNWLPVHTKKNRFSPNTYDTYISNLNLHILPYFGSRIMNSITSEDVEHFLLHLSEKPVRGSQSYNKNPNEIPTLSSASVKKNYDILIAGFPMAKEWGYMRETPVAKPPVVKSAKTKAWTPEEFMNVLDKITDKIMHLAISLAFKGSLREGETVGIDVRTINFREGFLLIEQEVQRVSDESLANLPKNEIIHVFPKIVSTSKSSLILKGPKTEQSERKLHLPPQLRLEIAERLKTIEECKEFFGADYNDNHLLICQPDGKPIDPKSIGKNFKKAQKDLGIANIIDFQGLRKSGQIHKIRISNYNYQAVSKLTNQTMEVLMNNYDEAYETEVRNIAMMVESDLLRIQRGTDQNDNDIASSAAPSQDNEDIVQNLISIIQENPALAEQIMQVFPLNAASNACEHK